MQIVRQHFNPRQHMITEDFEFFHYKDTSVMDIEYHNHDFYEMYFFLSGNVTYMIEGKSYRLRPWDILLISHKELHKPIIDPATPYERIVLWVNPEFVKKQSTESSNLTLCFEATFRNQSNLLRPDAEVAANIKHTMAKFEKACHGTGFGSEILTKSFLTELMVYINKAFMDVQGESLDVDIQYNEKVSSIIRYIAENLNEDLSLDVLAARFFMSKYHLLHEFKRHAGYSIHQYIQQKRLIMAKALLKEGMQVAEVCNRCGFGDYSNFIRAFKKAYGLPPKKYCKSKA